MTRKYHRPPDALAVVANDPRGATQVASDGTEAEEVTRIVAGGSQNLAGYVRELLRFRDLFVFLVRRDIKARYTQTVLGLGWAILQPLLTVVVFSVFFGSVAKINSGGVPYPVFSVVAVVPWTFFSNAVTFGSASLVSNVNLLSKIYFPRIFIPLSPLGAGLVDVAIALVLVFGVMAVYGVTPSIGAIALPALVALTALAAASVVVWLAPLAVLYRDVRYMIPFFLQIAIFATPVIYGLGAVPERLRLLYALNPMVGIIDAYRAALLGTPFRPATLVVSIAVVLFSLALGLRYFRRTEQVLADVA